MSNVELKPARVFEQFAAINRIPRPSKREEKMIAYLKAFGESHGLETRTDETGNVLIRKAATPGYEDRKTVILQSHMDMVCDKLVDVDFDFDRDAIQTYVDGEWLCARGTTLGADDGIGCAIELALLQSDDIEHGPIECVFTRDEETQLTGAMGMKAGFMNGDYLINLDSEDEGQLFVSCAGGRSTVATFTFEREQAPEGYFFMEASVKGLVGGHSGDDINKKRANAIKLLARFLYAQQQERDVRLASLQSGKLHNAIPRDGRTLFAVPAGDKETVKAAFNVYVAQVENEYHVSDSGMEFALASAEPAAVLPAATGRAIVAALQAVDNGVFAQCQDPEIDWLVETSSNVAAVATRETEVEVLSSQRSCVMSSLDNMCATVRAAYELAGARVMTTDGYPAWQPKAGSELVALARKTYVELFGHEPRVLGIHAGLECGLFSERYPELDMISFGPTLRYVHTPQERLHIPTVEMVWNHLLEMLRQIPAK